MKLRKAVAFAQVNFTDMATPNSLHPVALVSPLLCLFTHTAVLSGTHKSFSCVWQRLGGGHPSLGHSLRAVTAPDRVPFTQLTEHIEAKIHMALPLPGWSRLVALAPDDERVDHGRLQQPPTNVSPPPYRWPSSRVVRVVLVSQATPPMLVLYARTGLGTATFFLPPGAFLSASPISGWAFVERIATGRLSFQRVATMLPSWWKWMSSAFIFLAHCTFSSLGHPDRFMRIVEHICRSPSLPDLGQAGLKRSSCRRTDDAFFPEIGLPCGIGARTCPS